MTVQTIVLDANVVLDALLRRQPFERSALEVIRLVENGTVRGCLPATTVTTLFYFLRRAYGDPAARSALRLLADSFVMAPVDEGVLHAALARDGSDFEDDLVIEIAVRLGASAILTRDPTGFRESPVVAVSPPEWLASTRPDRA